MSKRPRSPVLLTAFTCGLALLAGGDDFNLVPIALPTLLTSVPADSLPLDDPNTDYTRAAESQAPSRPGRCRGLQPPTPRSASGQGLASSRPLLVPIRLSHPGVVFTPMHC